MMKKIGLFFICFVCVFDSAFARISVVNSIDNMIYINWEAVNVASEGITVVNNGDTDETVVKNAVAAFLDDLISNYLGKNISYKNFSAVCKKYLNNVTACMDFLKAYNNYVGGGDIDCTEATNTMISWWSTSVYGFENMMAECQKYKETGWFDQKTMEALPDVQPQKMKGDSLVGQCKFFLENVEKCQKYLTYYYAKEAYSAKRKDKEKYMCYIMTIPKLRRTVVRKCRSIFFVQRW